MPRLIAPLLLALPLAANALCTSDELPEPAALLERFISADCLECWSDPGTPKAGPGTVVLDWVVPSTKGEQAPLSAVATDDALERLGFLRHPPPERADAVAHERSGEHAALRLAQGEAFNDYVGTSMELRAPGREAWWAWLMLVETLPAGTEGSPVPRNLVRNVFRPEWAKVMRRPPGMLAEARVMQIREGSRPQRLRLVAVLQDARGRIRAIRQTECRE